MNGPIAFVATCLRTEQTQICAQSGIETFARYVHAYGDIVPGCVTDFSVHCFNSEALKILKDLGVGRATLHPELNLAQIRDIKKCIPTEAVIYGRIPLMKLGVPLSDGFITDRTGTQFFLHGGTLYNSVPIFMADKLDELEKSGITHGRFIFTTESAEDVRAVLAAYKHRKGMNIKFTRGKFYSKV
jgi:putative protease